MGVATFDGGERTPHYHRKGEGGGGNFSEKRGVRRPIEIRGMRKGKGMGHCHPRKEGGSVILLGGGPYTVKRGGVLRGEQPGWEEKRFD